MNKIERALGAVKTVMLGDKPKTPTELAASIRKDIVAMKGHIAYLDSEKVNQLCGQFHLRVLSIHDSHPLHDLVHPALQQRVKADGEVKSRYADIGNKVRRYCEQEQRRGGHVSHLWREVDRSIDKAVLGQLPEKLEEFARRLEESDLIA